MWKTPYSSPQMQEWSYGFGKPLTEASTQPKQGKPPTTPGIQSGMNPAPSKQVQQPWEKAVQGYRPAEGYGDAWNSIDMKRRNDMLSWLPDFREAYLRILSETQAEPGKLYWVQDTPDQAEYQIGGDELAQRIWNKAHEEVTARAQAQQSAQAAAMNKQNYWYRVLPRFV